MVPPALITAGRFPNYDIGRDGQRLVGFFVLEDTGGNGAVLQTTFLVDFFDELKRRTP